MTELNKPVKTYTNRNVCRGCNGTGVVSRYVRTLPHGRGDEYADEKCIVCNGNGIVDVIKEVKTTIVPVEKGVIEP